MRRHASASASTEEKSATKFSQCAIARTTELDSRICDRRNSSQSCHECLMKQRAYSQMNESFLNLTGADNHIDALPKKANGFGLKRPAICMNYHNENEANRCLIPKHETRHNDCSVMPKMHTKRSEKEKMAKPLRKYGNRAKSQWPRKLLNFFDSSKMFGGLRGFNSRMGLTHPTESCVLKPETSLRISRVSSLLKELQRTTVQQQCNASNGDHHEYGFEMELSGYIERLWSLKDRSNRAKMLTEPEMSRLCMFVRNLFLNQPAQLDIMGPVKIVGDIHGQFADLLHVFELCGKPEKVNYLFLGDYVDRGRHSLETIALLFCYKLLYPRRFFLLRGNHESASITKIYGFYDECKRRFTVKLWRVFVDTFMCMPFVAFIENQIFCCHGGLSPEMFTPDITNLQDLKQKFRDISRPVEVPDSGLLCDIFWSDPWYIESTPNEQEPYGWRVSERGVSFMFAPNVVDDFLERFGLDLIVRAHQVIEDGYEFYAERSLVTVFSAPNYCGEFDNAAAVFCLSKQGGGGEDPSSPKWNPYHSIMMDTQVGRNNSTPSVAQKEESGLEGSFQIIRSISTRKRKVNRNYS